MSDKGSIWQVVINNPNDDDRQRCNALPGYAKAFVFQDEVAPDTGTLHINGALTCKYGVALSALKKWQPRAHFNRATTKQHSENILKYAHKDETAVAGTQKTAEGFGFASYEILTLLASQMTPEDEMDLFIEPNVFWRRAVVRVLRINCKLAGSLMNPSLKTMFLDTYRVWSDRAQELSKAIVDGKYIPDVAQTNDPTPPP